MKKLLALLLPLCMVFFCACGSDTETSEETAAEVTEEVVEEDSDGESFDPGDYIKEEVPEPTETIEEPVEEVVTEPIVVEEITPEETVTETSQIVYVTRTGSKYHSAGCQYLKKSCIEKDLTDAQNQGYTPCSKCW